MEDDSFSEAHVNAGSNLIELITPDSEQLDAYKALYQEALYDAGRDNNVIEVVTKSLQDKAAFVITNHDNDELIEHIGQLALAWDVDVLFGSHDSEEEYTYYVDVPSLLNAAYTELQFAGLTLWSWQIDDEHIGGFIARASDEDLIEKIAQLCQIDLFRANELYL